MTVETEARSVEVNADMLVIVWADAASLLSSSVPRSAGGGAIESAGSIHTQ
jgi:hypothetical protein